jgi:hypothetical protein
MIQYRWVCCDRHAVEGGGPRCDSASVPNGAVWFSLLLWYGFLPEYSVQNSKCNILIE